MKNNSLIDQAHAIIDKGYSDHIAEQEKKLQTNLACQKGCHSCCLKPTINIFEPEVWRIVHFVKNEAEDELKAIILENIKKNEDFIPCPFLVNGECGIYPVRPITCRTFNVLRQKCKIGEDPSVTRPNDILTPHLESIKDSGFLVLEYYGIIDQQEKELFFNMGFLLQKSILAHELDWNRLMVDEI